ncbi:hypothetical protein HFP67_26340 [Bacillus sp. CB102A.1]
MFHLRQLCIGFLYLRYQDESVVGVDRYFWLGSSLIVSMLCYLVFELFDPIRRGEMDDVVTESRNPISKFFAKVGRQKDICVSLLLQ